jgi:FkbM family methyltransferase
LRWAWIFGRPFFNRFNSLLFFLSLRGMGLYNSTSLLLSGERWLLINVVKKMGKNLIIFDIGANIGDYSKEIINCGVIAEKIYAFEPHPETYRRLKDNVKDTKGVVIPINVAMSDKKGQISLYDRSDVLNGSSHASLSEDIFLEVHHQGTKEIKTNVDTISSFCVDNQLNSIDFLKIDVEGYELNVLHGAEQLLRTQNIRMIQFEFTQLNSTVGIFFKQFYKLLAQDYHLYRLLPHGLRAINITLRYVSCMHIKIMLPY